MGVRLTAGYGRDARVMPLSSMHGLYNLVYREEEREMKSLCDVEGIRLIPWSLLACGLLARQYGGVNVRGEKDEMTKG